jgi:hypothetical protein
MRCFKCNSKDHPIAECPYNSDNDDDNKKSKKKDKKEKDKMTFKKKKKKKSGSYVVTWDSDASSSDDDDSNDNKTTKKKALASIAIIISLLSLTLHQLALWLRPLRYNPMMSVMRNMIKVKVKIKMMNQLKINYLTCWKMLKNILILREGNAKTCVMN